MSLKFPYSGRKFKLTMDNSLSIINNYSNDGKTIEIEFLNGDLKGTTMEVPFTWRQLPDNNFLISWQESTKATVVHCDNFENKKSYAYYTTMDGDFFVMEGTITSIQV
ncbi:MoaF-related domain-containing protein [Morganella psychrotolerans]|uniref:MoaF-related domain-containing protein n=1 Tax=Morganella psychrotolerans TaxID=368603 RepID=UPI0039AED19E